MGRASGYLGFGEAEAAGQLLAFGAHHVVVLLEGSFQPQELRRREGGADALGFPGEGAVEEQAFLGHLAPCGQRARLGSRAGTPPPPPSSPFCGTRVGGGVGETRSSCDTGRMDKGVLGGGGSWAPSLWSRGGVGQGKGKGERRKEGEGMDGESRRKRKEREGGRGKNREKKEDKQEEEG